MWIKFPQNHAKSLLNVFLLIINISTQLICGSTLTMLPNSLIDGYLEPIYFSVLTMNFLQKRKKNRIYRDSSWLWSSGRLTAGVGAEHSMLV
jgi:hypothetical protein